jgi:hypothetical protein
MNAQLAPLIKLTIALTSLLVAMTLCGCVKMPEINHGLGTTCDEARVDLDRMARDPKTTLRHIVVLNGYHALPTLASRIARKLRNATSGDCGDFLTISFTFSVDLDSMVSSVIRKVEETWPSSDPRETVEVDVVGISMGGLIARWAALPPERRVRAGAKPPSTPDGKRLKIARLFTLGTPHRGAIAADAISIDAAARDMRSDSPFLATLNSADPGYEIIAYAQLRDHLSGATRCAPPDHVPIWTSGTWFLSHLETADNPIFLADIAARLRGEPPKLEPGTPPPRD